MIDSKTRLMGLIGDPIEHSKSPLIQNYINEITHQNIVYLCFQTKNDHIEQKLDAFKKLSFKGINVTIPHKPDVIKYLDKVDKDVLKINACNTIKFTNEGLFGYNTDISGFINAFMHDTASSLKNKKVVVLGAGGSSRAIVYALIKEEAKSISILNRTLKRAEILYEEFKSSFESLSCHILGNNSEEILSEADIIINTTSVGMFPKIDSDPLEFFSNYSKKQIIYDIIFNPINTKLMLNARSKGAIAINGLSMLIFQAIKSFEIINDVTLVNEQIEDILRYVTNKINEENV